MTIITEILTNFIKVSLILCAKNYVQPYVRYTTDHKKHKETIDGYAVNLFK